MAAQLKAHKRLQRRNMLVNKSLLFTVLATMTGIMADTGALIVAWEGVVLTFSDGHTVGPDQIHYQTYTGDPTIDGASFKVNNGATVSPSL